MLSKSVEEECSIISKECSIISMFLTSFNVYFVFGYACFMCLCLKTTIHIFGGKVWLFMVRTSWQPCEETCRLSLV